VMFLLSCERSTKPEEENPVPEQLSLSVSPESGAWFPDDVIEVVCSEADARIYFNIGFADPDTNHVLYSGPILLSSLLWWPHSEVTINFRAFKDGFLPSETITRTYTYSLENTVAQPVISTGGNYPDAGTEITITCATPDARIYYTINGNPPYEYSALYTQPLVLNHSGPKNIQARAYKEGMNPSPLTWFYCFLTHPLQPMQLVEGGTFDNGTSNITLSSFYIDQYEVSQKDYYDVMATYFTVPIEIKANYPVYYVSWLNAIEYCNRRSILDGLQPCYSLSPGPSNPDYWPPGWSQDPNSLSAISCNWSNSGYRLPTEMEWMFAAKGGILGKGYNYSGHDSISVVAWYNSNSGYSVHPVGTRAANELGIYDLSGNLWEWCWDIFGPYPAGNQTDPHGSENGSTRVLRGGSFYSDAASCLSSSRYSYDPMYYQATSIGFRCVRKAF